MDIAIWVAQGLLAVVMLMAGMMKIIQSKEKMQEKMAWAEDFDANVIKGIGAIEVLGAIGLIAPWYTEILPILTPLAGVGLAITMMGAAYTHFRRGNEMPMLGMNIMLMMMGLFIAYGRFVLVPFVEAVAT